MIEQRTIRSKAALAGVGLHTGAPVHLELLPAAAGAGITFVRTDLPGRPRVAAALGSLVSRPRRTALASGPAEVHTTEHLLAALWGAGVTNLEAHLDGPELPGLDGSAAPFLEAILGAGVVGQGAAAPVLAVREALSVEDRGGVVVALPAERTSITYVLDYSAWRQGGAAPGAPLPVQLAECELGGEAFRREIAPARTFVLEEEALQLQKEGLGKGATAQNTLIWTRDGVLHNQLRFPNEPARHKLLDLLGDLYLAGAQVRGRILAIRSGHTLNARMAALILESSGARRELAHAAAGA
jgi:UDP-3-O-[3-hydroxymyristoyl] N-acetylglucosamine deacetylase/3-hydroxyacyl-[acyl-carrier-protein] dehydratase